MTLSGLVLCLLSFLTEVQAALLFFYFSINVPLVRPRGVIDRSERPDTWSLFDYKIFISI